ncbi:hypothetical protein [Rhodovulum sulfidophilum]|uniref:hypothetical protein n=3 Tax=Rhodovulum sulfidophilum TaxID=35806 RepID=UPI001F42BB11|nr:hypothetical protein [Rhodovulum sulfidophilum]MCE8433519.1 hypothetical protein [Rhodovulum sulfidophilum]
MAVPRNYQASSGDCIIIVSGERGERVHHAELLKMMMRSRSLAEVRRRFHGSRSNLLKTLAHFGYDFDMLLREQFQEGHRDAQLARLHRVDQKWIAEKRRALGFASHKGRPRVERSAEDVAQALHAAGSFVGAADLLSINRKTFKRLHDEALDCGFDMGSDRPRSAVELTDAEGLVRARSAADRVGTKTGYSSHEMKTFFDDGWEDSG